MQFHGGEPDRRRPVLGVRRLPPYFDALIAARRAGQVGPHVHLGYWDDPSAGGTFEAAQVRLTEQILDLSALRDGQSVLDIACGFGGTLAAIDRRRAGMRLTGLNIDSRQLALCRGVVPGAGLVAGDACALPFRSASFEHAFCVEAMFHFGSRRRFLSEAARVLRPGGCLVVSDILLRQPSLAPWDAGTIAAIIRRDYGPWPDPWVDVAAILAWADEAGLQAVEVRDWSTATRPSYGFVAPEGQPRDSAGQVFRWLHGNGYLAYSALSFRRR
jgi:MPBQ/MSBQ methyltransferase